VQAPATGLSVKSTAEGLRVTLNSLVLFDTGKAELKASSKSELGQVVQLLQAYPTNLLRISGYTDSVGAGPYNQTLSEQRAQSVADYLQADGGISKSRLRVVGWGKRRPVATNSTAEGRQQNRRVEIDILK
jgi:outer membrane protein OmpA-like peptidoglycan-associated protein